MLNKRRQLGLGIAVDHKQLWAELPATRIMYYMFNNVFPSVPLFFWYKNSVNPENYRAQCLQFCFVFFNVLSIIEIFKEIDHCLLILFGRKLNSKRKTCKINRGKVNIDMHY